jgi:3-hydroxyisobutyrate dehydrogenase-like beta-hydroxyacid dehydrogenase
MKVGLIGLGGMAKAMAKNLVAAGHDVKIWNRSGGEVEGATMVGSPVDALQGEVTLTMLSDDTAISSVLLDSGAINQAATNLIHVVMSTISVAFARELVTVHEQAGIAYVSAPVLGRPNVAASGELNILAGGPPAAINKVTPIFQVLGKRVWELGPDAPTANAAKVACNMMIAMTIEALGEAVVITEANGLERSQFFELILGTLFGCRAYQNYSQIIAEGVYEPGFRAVLGLKDLRLAREAVAPTGRSLPMLDAVHGQMTKTVDAGLGERDWSSMAAFTIDPDRPV